MMLPIASAILKSLFGQHEARKDLPREGDESTGESDGRQGPHGCWGMGIRGPQATGKGQGHTHVLDTRCGLNVLTMRVN